MMKRIYADYAASTPLCEPAIQAIGQAISYYGNPSEAHAEGRNARSLLHTAKQQVADAIGAKPDEIYFTSGGTEADNWALRGIAESRKKKGKHIITSSIEHHAVLNTAVSLEKMGYQVTYLPVNRCGQVNPDDVRTALRSDTILISVMTANNEVGTIQPIEEIGEIAYQAGVPFHTDAVQAIGHIPIRVHQLPVDLLSISAHKFGGPKGIGALYIQKETASIAPLLFGGAQEAGHRAGTENILGITAMGAAVQWAIQNIASTDQLQRMTRYLTDGILEIPGATLTGHPDHRIPGTASFLFQGVEGASLVALLDREGLAASSRAACSRHTLGASHVLRAMGYQELQAIGALRLSLGWGNTMADIPIIVHAVKEAVHELRAP